MFEPCESASPNGGARNRRLEMTAFAVAYVYVSFQRCAVAGGLQSMRARRRRPACLALRVVRVWGFMRPVCVYRQRPTAFAAFKAKSALRMPAAAMSCVPPQVLAWSWRLAGSSCIGAKP